MPYNPVAIENFTGLNLLDDPGTVGWGGAVDLLNVDFDQRGRVRSRDGYAKFTSVVGTNRYDSFAAFYDPTASTRLVAGAGSRLEAISTAGAVATSLAAGISSSPHYFARYGSPTAQEIYIANGLDTVRKFNGAFSTPVYTGTTPDGQFIGVTPWDNRLVNAGIKSGGGLKNLQPRVLFSGAGTPTTFGANDFVDLHPGDGEQFQGVAAWRDLLFVFKESKFFVFYGTSTDSSGNPIFNYRAVQGVGARGSALAAGPDALYFANRRGIWATSGGPPTLISSAMDPIFQGNTNSFFASSALNQAQTSLCAMSWHNNRLWFAYPSGSATANDRLLVYDPAGGRWTLFDIPAAAFCPLRVSNAEDLMFAYASGTNDIGRHSSSYTQDGGDGTSTGVAIASRHRSGFSDLGHPELRRKRIRRFHVRGTGTVNVAVATDDGSLGSSTSTVLTGPFPNYRIAQRGRNFSWQVSASTAWRLDSLIGDVG